MSVPETQYFHYESFNSSGQDSLLPILLRVRTVKGAKWNEHLSLSNACKLFLFLSLMLSSDESVEPQFFAVYRVVPYRNTETQKGHQGYSGSRYFGAAHNEEEIMAGRKQSKPGTQ